MEIKPFSGEKPITSLTVIPCDIWDKTDNDELRQRLVKEGRRWFDFLSGKQVEYSGELASPDKKPVRIPCDYLLLPMLIQ